MLDASDPLDDLKKLLALMLPVDREPETACTACFS